MRTYTRKRQQYQFIDNVKELCRLCLEKCEGETVPIFKEDETAIAALALRIMVCVGIEIKNEENLPNSICSNCHKELEKYYIFRKKCEMSYQRLKSHLFASKEIQNRLIKNEDIVYMKNDMEDIEIHVIDKSEPQDENLNEMEKIEIELIEEEEHPDLQTFLTSILMELGIMERNNQLVVQEHAIRNFELETGDNDLISIELIEEDDNEVFPEDTQQSTQVNNETLDDKKLILDMPTNNEQKKNNKKSGSWCSICGRVFSSRSACMRHGAVHSRRKPHECTICHRTFAQKSVLDRHKLVHQDRRPFACTSCDKSFTQRGALEAHTLTHSSPPARRMTLHACQHCDKVFLYSSGLTRHMLTHAGVTHTCASCGRQFNDPSSLVRHLRNRHNACRPDTPNTSDT